MFNENATSSQFFSVTFTSFSEHLSFRTPPVTAFKLRDLENNLGEAFLKKYLRRVKEKLEDFKRKIR